MPVNTHPEEIPALDEEKLISDIACQIESFPDIAATKIFYVRRLTQCAAVEIAGPIGILPLLISSFGNPQASPAASTALWDETQAL